MARRKAVRLTALGIKNSQKTGVLIFSGVGFPTLNLTGEDYTYTTNPTPKKAPKEITIKGATKAQMRGIFDRFKDLGGQLEEVELKKQDEQKDE